MAEKENMIVDKYLRDIQGQSLLSDDEERQLSGRILRGDVAAPGELAQANLKFVVALANQYRGKGIDMADLISEGNIAMLEAAQRFDASRGKRFVSFAAPAIRQAMEQAIERQTGLGRVPKDLKEKISSKRKTPVSIDQPINEHSPQTLVDVIANKDAAAADNGIEQSTLNERMLLAIARLDDRQQQVIKHFFGIGAERLTLAEIAQRMGIKRERARQIRDKALRRMR